MPGFHSAETMTAPMMTASSARLMSPCRRIGALASPTGATRRSWRKNHRSTATKIASTQPATNAVGSHRFFAGQKKSMPLRKPMNSGRVAERRQRAADIADEENEEHHDMDVVEPRRIGPD